MDEMGSGTKPLRKYGYSKIGMPAILERKKQIVSYNLTCSVTISKQGVEFLQFSYKKGTTNESYLRYFKALMKFLKKKYKNKIIFLVLDNLWAHKS